MYCNLDEIKSIIPQKDLINLTNDTTPSDTINEDIIEDCSEFADELINSYIRKRYLLPLKYVPKIISKIAADITAYRLYSRRLNKIPEQIQRNCEYAIDNLKLLKDGQIVLDVSGTSNAGNLSLSSTYLSNKTTQDRIFNDSVMRTFL